MEECTQYRGSKNLGEDDQEGLDFFWDVGCDGISPDNRRSGHRFYCERTLAVFFKLPVMNLGDYN